MNSSTFENEISPKATATASLKQLYIIRAVFSITWVILVAVFAKSSPGIASILFIIYPAWDAIATLIDLKTNPDQTNRIPQYINTAISVIVTIAVVVALQQNVSAALIVFGVWAILTGGIQLILALRRRKILNGQWPMIISGAQSIIGGSSFILLAHAPGKGVASLAGYAAFGAFYYLLAVWRLSRS